MLYPVVSSARKVFSLDGLWRFKLDSPKLSESWAKKPLEDPLSIVVPASFNEQYEGEDFRNHCGWMWYEREFSIPSDALDGRVCLRIDAAAHYAKVYINGVFLMEHMGGFTPFEAEINHLVKAGGNRLSIAIDNTLNETTLPVGDVREIQTDSGVLRRNVPNCDFFNYAGLNRSVRLYTTPKAYIEDISITPSVKGTDGHIAYQAVTKGSGDLSVTVYDENNNLVAEGKGSEGVLIIKNVRLWQPLNAYLYKMHLSFAGDEHIEEFGVRTIEIKNRQFLINGKPFYFKGFGKHEDAHVNGRGLNPAYYMKDINLMKWMGANSFRTSHYPYSEEFLRMCDRTGIVVINECAGVGLNFSLTPNFGIYRPGTVTWDTVKTFENHKQALKELIARDKNYACVVMWSVSNEAEEETEGAYEYFKPLFDLVRSSDPQKRPVCNVSQGGATFKTSKTASLTDVVCLNRYYGWYSENLSLRQAETGLRKELRGWVEKYPDKPILFTEYGTDTIAGIHDTTPEMFSEEYQTDFFAVYSKVFDEFPSVIGEQLWNFADFATYPGIYRVQGNKKGIFTRERKPKMVVHWLKTRWLNIADFNYKK